MSKNLRQCRCLGCGHVGDGRSFVFFADNDAKEFKFVLECPECHSRDCIREVKSK